MIVKTNVLCITLFVVTLLSCQEKKMGITIIQDQEIKTTLKENINTNNEDKRSLTTVKFEDQEVLPIVSNFFTDKNIDSIKIRKKEFRANYNYCGKGKVNLKLFNSIKSHNQSEYSILSNINTAHQLIVDKDTLYIADKSNSSCLNKGDHVFVKATVYQFFYNNQDVNLLLIDNIKAIPLHQN